jgi:8-oxo-dGTP pyrophosphatase MutT (NUDIX family)
MKFFRKNKHLGTILYYLLWPLVWFYAPLRVRVRVIIQVQKEVLVVKNWFGPNIGQLPGGGMKFGETLVNSAKREIMEEIGISLDNTQIKLLSNDIQIVHQQGLLFRYQYALVDLEKKPIVKLSLEITEYKWLPIEELKIPQNIKSIL